MITPTDEGIIYWHIVNFTDKMDKYKVILAMEQCFNKWQDALDKIEPVGRAITFKTTDDYNQAHIRLFFLTPKENEFRFTISDGSEIRVISKWPMDGPNGKLAHRPPGKHELHFDNSEAWSDIHEVDKNGDVTKVQLWQVAMHEMGHVLDLGHCDDETAIMYPKYDGMHTDITKDDINGLQKAWGKIKRKYEDLIPPAAYATESKVLHVQYKLPRKTAYKKRTMAGIKQIVIHHSADNGTVESIASYHISKGWPGIGYTYVIYKDGTIYHVNDLDEACYNVAEQNSKSLGICLIGNYEKETPPDIQVASLKWLVKTLRAVVNNVEVVGHRDRVNTSCPGKNLYDIVKTLA